MKRKILCATVVLSGLVTGALAVLAQAPGTPSRAPAIATVGKHTVPKADYESRVAQAIASYRERAGSEVPDAFAPLLRRHVLESMIRTNLLMLEAERRGVRVDNAEAERELKRHAYFSEGGQFNEARYEAVRLRSPDAFTAALNETKQRLAGMRMQQQVEREHGPDRAAITKDIRRDLTSATLDVLSLPYVAFSGQEREPSEKEILDFYRANTKEFMRPARAIATILAIQELLPDSLQQQPAEVRARDARTQNRADSALAALRSGASMTSMEHLGTLHHRLEIRRDNFPGMWRGDERTRAALFAQPANSFMPEPVRARNGWLVVRVDAASMDRPAPLKDVSPQIRRTLRDRAIKKGDEGDLRKLYDSLADSLRAPAASIRYAIFDTSSVAAPEPDDRDLDRYYRGHLADYSSFDAAKGEIIARPFEEVKDDVRARWKSERRLLESRSVSEKVLKAWRSSKRDTRAEAQAARLVEAGPLLLGQPVDDGPFGRALGDTMRARDGRKGVGSIPLRQGMLVFSVHGRVENHRPAFESIQDMLTAIHEEREGARLEAAAREMFDANPDRFATEPTVHFSRVLVPQPDLLKIHLTREEVEKWHRDHLEEYAAPELAGARHILIEPSATGPGPDQAARVKAQGILRRIRAGEDFNALAREFSDDGPTRESGGDLGTFGRGVLLPELEEVAFSLRPGEVSDVVKSRSGYHIIKCTAFEPMEIAPLPRVYSNVSADAARDKAIRVTRERADSLFQTIRSPEEAERKARELGYPLFRNRRVRGQDYASDDMLVYFQTLDDLDPGKFYPGVQELRGQGFVITWIDSIAPPRAPRWERIRDDAIQTFLSDAGRRAVSAKRAELDRLEAQGWSFDSLSTLFGGVQRLDEVRVGDGLPELRGASTLDSLIFGTENGDALAPGELTPWIAFPGGLARVRLVEVLHPSPSQLAERVDREYRARLERNLYFYYEELKRKHAVRILDRELNALSLPPPKPVR